MEIVIVAIFFLLGISVGSFLNVVADRVPAGQSLLRPPSHCFSCGHMLEPRDLFPIVSYLLLKGKCRYCGHRIPARSMLVELASGLLFVLALTVFGLTWQTLVTIVFGCFFIILFVTDLEKELLPHLIVYPGIAAALVFAALRPLTGTTPGLLSALAGLGICLGTLLLMWAASRMLGRDFAGAGDAGLAALTGASLGYPVALVGLCIAIIAWGLTSAMLALFKAKMIAGPVRPGLFLALGGMLGLFCGQDIVDALWQLFMY